MRVYNELSLFQAVGEGPTRLTIDLSGLTTVGEGPTRINETFMIKSSFVA